jgi:hypothetical protein
MPVLAHLRPAGWPTRTCRHFADMGDLPRQRQIQIGTSGDTKRFRTGRHGLERTCSPSVESLRSISRPLGPCAQVSWMMVLDKLPYRILEFHTGDVLGNVGIRQLSRVRDGVFRAVRRRARLRLEKIFRPGSRVRGWPLSGLPLTRELCAPVRCRRHAVRPGLTGCLPCGSSAHTPTSSTPGSAQRARRYTRPPLPNRASTT